MRKTVLVTGVIVCGLCVLQCDVPVDVEFTPTVGLVGAGDDPMVVNLDEGCEPGETLVYPIRDRKGITQVTTGLDGELLAKADDCRTYTFDGEAWRPNYSLIYRYAQPGIIPNGAEGDYPRGNRCVDIWYPEGLGEILELNVAGIGVYNRNYINTLDFGLFAVDEGWSSDDAKFTYGTAVWGTSRYAYLETRIRLYYPPEFFSVEGNDVTKSDEFVSERFFKAGGGISLYEYADDEGAHMDRGLTYVPDIPFMDVFGNSIADFFAVGNELQTACPRVTGNVYHCNDSACELELNVSGVTLKSIHGVSGDNLFVVGGNDERSTNGVIFQRRKGKWIRYDLPTDIPLNKVWAADSKTVYAVGGAYDKDGAPSSVALRLSGGEWEILDVDSTRPLYDVFGLSGDDVHIVGEEGFFHYGTARQNDWPAIQADELCDLYNKMYDGCHFAEVGDPLGVQTCETALLDVFAEGGDCADSAFSLLDCMLHQSCDEALKFSEDPTNPDAACATEYAAVDCPSFPPEISQ